MTSDVRELLGDLVVASEELVADPTHRERWLHLVAETAVAMRGAREVPTDLLAALVTTFERRGILAAMCDPRPGLDWRELCVLRTGLESMRDIVEPFLLDEIDTSVLEGSMRIIANAMFEPLEAPAGTPAHHWWWFAAEPPNEHSLVMNSAMRHLLPLYPGPVSREFRMLVADGFVTIGECLFLRAPQRVHTDMDPTTREWSHNTIRLEDYLPADPSRRPVDLAGSALACTRHLAYELRRRPFAPCRIITSVRARTGVLRFHQTREAPAWTPEYLAQQVDATLVLETV